MASCYSLPKGHWYVSQMPPVWYIYLQNWVILEVTFETYFIYIYIWLVVWTPLKNMKVSWDDDIPNISKNKIHVPNHQPDIYIYI